MSFLFLHTQHLTQGPEVFNDYLQIIEGMNKAGLTVDKETVIQTTSFL